MTSKKLKVKHLGEDWSKQEPWISIWGVLRDLMVFTYNGMTADKGLIEIKGYIDPLLLQARADERREIVEKCQAEMFEALEEVAQYGKNLVNKEDIKVWIFALTNLIKEK